MGLDGAIYIRAKKNTTEELLNKLDGNDGEIEIIAWRRFWELQEKLCVIIGEVIENCVEHELSKDNIIEIIRWLTDLRNGFVEFDDYDISRIDEDIDVLIKFVKETDFEKYDVFYCGWW